MNYENMNSEQLYIAANNCDKKGENELAKYLRRLRYIAVYNENFKYDENKTPEENFFAEDHAMLLVYEETLRDKNKKKQKATYTRKLTERRGKFGAIIHTIESGPKKTYYDLLELGIPQFSNEHLVMKYKSLFPKEIIEKVSKYYECPKPRPTNIGEQNV